MALIVGAHGASAGSANPLMAISYHDVVEHPSDVGADRFTVTIDQLINQLAWLDAHGFEPITLDQWAAAAAHWSRVMGSKPCASSQAS